MFTPGNVFSMKAADSRQDFAEDPTECQPSLASSSGELPPDGSIPGVDHTLTATTDGLEMTPPYGKLSVLGDRIDPGRDQISRGGRSRDFFPSDDYGRYVVALPYHNRPRT